MMRLEKRFSDWRQIMMKAYSYTDQYGSFRMEHPDHSSYLYFPLAGESGLKSCVTPLLGGDSKLDQNSFLLQPVSVEELHGLKGGRNFWCLTERGAWSAAGNSAEAEFLRGTEEEEDCVLEAGLMWHRLSRSSKKYGLSSVITSFVPWDGSNFEVMEVTVRNEGESRTELTPVAAVPLYCRSADNLRDHRHVTSLLHRMRVTRYGLEVTPTLTFDERGHKRNTLTYFVYGTDGEGGCPEACCPRLADFIGEGGSLTHPEQIYGSKNASCPAEGIWQGPGAEDAGWEAVGALRFEKRILEPGEEATYCLYLGIAEAETAQQDGERLIRDFGGRAAVERALERVMQKWREKVNVRYETGDRDLDGYLYWVSFQPVLRRIYGCSFLPYHDYGKGGRGWRDLWQDCLALLIMEPDQVGRMLEDYYGGVRLDGTNATIIGQKQGEFLADRNRIVRVWMDHGLWPFVTTEFYIRQTGDLEILGRQAPYFKDAQIYRGERRDEMWRQEQGTCQRSAAGDGEVVRGSILEHLLIQNITAFYDVGEHNHIRLRGADWNDGFDMAAENGESVAFTAAYAGNLEQLAELTGRYAERCAEAGKPAAMAFHEEVCPLLCDRSGIYGDGAAKRALLETYYASCAHSISGKKKELPLKEIAAVLRGMAAWTKEHIRQTEWLKTPEGSFYNGYYDNHKRRLEGVFPGGIRMTLTGQVFPIMSGTATDGQVREIAEAADALLYSPRMGGYRLNTDFGEVKEDMGRAFGFAYGHKENGAVFSHMAVMYANALYRRGFIREGYRALDALYRQSSDFEKSRIYPGLPEYFEGRGRGMYPYLTGSASWLMLTMVTEVYGVKGYYGDLLLEPKLLDGQLDGDGRTGIYLKFAGVPLHVVYEAGQRAEVYTGVKELYLDGEKVSGSLIAREKLLCGDTKRREIKGIL
ncbi:MAG: cellobiose phosphorylase [bacterium]|nr:cellobiose phosphorylase [bacterium]